MDGLRNHVTVVEYVCFHAYDGQPIQQETKFFKKIASDEEPYKRKIRIGEDWEPLDCGWVKEAGVLVLANEEGKYLQANPTEDEQAALDAKIVEVSFLPDPPPNNCWEVPPGEAMRGFPGNLKSLYVHCQSGVARCIVFVVPR